MERKITKIAAISKYDAATNPICCQKRVAAYARVSTSSDEQLLSIEAQKDYYLKYIAARPNWEFAGLYADEGISGTSSKNREYFNRMIRDALDGKADLIITKSISRFARNTLDTLTNIRKLKAAGVEVFFEKEQIFTFDSKGEFMLTLLSSMAQEESRSLSENVAWGQRKRFADGRYSLPYGQFLGYKKGNDGKPEVVEEDANIIKNLYRLYLEGITPSHIAAILTSEGVPSPGGCHKWRNSTIISILSNEKYYGAALLQKRFTEDFLTKKQRLNNGELPKYFIEDDHEAIISKATFEEVQRRMGRHGSDNPSLYAFSNKIVCGDCGGKYGRKIDGSYQNNKKYRKAVWKCNRKYTLPDKCKTPVLHEKTALSAFNQAIISLWETRTNLKLLCRKVVTSSIRANKLKGTKSERLCGIDRFIAQFGEHSLDSIVFDDSAWRVIIDQAVATSERLLNLIFVDGSSYTCPIPRHYPVKQSEIKAGLRIGTK